MAGKFDGMNWETFHKEHPEFKPENSENGVQIPWEEQGSPDHGLVATISSPPAEQSFVVSR